MPRAGVRGQLDDGRGERGAVVGGVDGVGAAAAAGSGALPALDCSGPGLPPRRLRQHQRRRLRPHHLPARQQHRL